MCVERVLSGPRRIGGAEPRCRNGVEDNSASAREGGAPGLVVAELGASTSPPASASPQSCGPQTLRRRRSILG